LTTTQLPSAFKFLFTPSRYKAAHGGRGSAKSHSFAKALLILARRGPKRILCAREVQHSIRDSSKRLLDDKIKELEWDNFFESTDQEIRGPNGSLFLFAGLRQMSSDAVRSMEGVDIAWVDEANAVSQISLQTLIPTIRKPDSELWFSWNPRSPKDPVDNMFRGGEPPPSSIVREIHWYDNPFFPEVLKKDLEWDKRRDPDKYAHVWLGGYQRRSEARVFHNWKIEEFVTPANAHFYYGADWGYSVDPTVLVRCFILDRKLYIDYEAYKVGCTIESTPNLFREVPQSNKWTITADCARPETIDYMKRNGFPMIKPSKKGAGSVEDGIEFLKSYDIVVHPRCTHTIDELATYSFKTDKMTGEVLAILEDKNNHVVDAIRYSIFELRKSTITRISPAIIEASRNLGSSSHADVYKRSHVELYRSPRFR